ncbi:MAG: BON domain-containing protein [Verrucomicrobiae bacterium]|nr:BON domain-containing protein [Verrucomicrobiae bacterium]
MRIDFGAERTDEEIVASIINRWRWQTYVKPRSLRLEVKDGQAVIRGRIGSPALRRSVIRLAEQVSGVKSVDSDGLEVVPADFDDTQRSMASLKRPDGEIEEAIRDGLAHDPRVFSFVPDVEVKNGFVTLRGKVATLAAKNAVAQVARNTPGTRIVHNYLKVRNDKPLRDDSEIADEIRAAFKEIPGTDAYKIDVQVRDGNVTLRGEVEELWERVRAGVVVTGIEGVKTLKNRLEVEDGFIDLFEDDTGWNGSGIPNLRSGSVDQELLDDDQIEEKIEHELRWDTRFAGAEIAVKVTGRTAALRGNAPNPTVRNLVVALAYRAGAIGVTTNIEIFPNTLKSQLEP